jgi:hypothetical protein
VPDAQVETLVLDLADLGGMRTYMTSKLATAVFAQELARRVAATTV